MKMSFLSFLRSVKMKEYKYRVIFKDGQVEIMNVEAESILDGHYRIYRQFGGEYSKSTYLG